MRQGRHHRHQFNATQRAFVLNRDGGVCYVCHQIGALQVDHIRPVAEGGATVVENAAAIHAEPCHRVKSEQERKRGYDRQRARLNRAAPKHPFDYL